MISDKVKGKRTMPKARVNDKEEAEGKGEWAMSRAI